MASNDQTEQRRERLQEKGVLLLKVMKGKVDK